jgi:hypothetical protein
MKMCTLKVRQNVDHKEDSSVKMSNIGSIMRLTAELDIMLKNSFLHIEKLFILINAQKEATCMRKNIWKKRFAHKLSIGKKTSGNNG